MARYSWMIILAVIAAIAIVGFFIFIFGDMERIKALKKPKWMYLLNISLFMIAAVCIVLAIYLYFDVQEQIKMLEDMMT